MAREPFWYLATPYSGYPDGCIFAFQHACQATGHLLHLGVRVFCPIVHTHPLAIEGGLGIRDLDFWLGVDGPMIQAAVGIIVLKMKSWTESEGIKAEIKIFREAGKPILYMEWEDAIHQEK